ncbi:MAG: Tyrosine recombinase XerC [Candidatus Magasanikbacteria bacterium GW2011_GWC2_40_17]|uniref:Tyrosine recombinase XerC n=1 Tax=Candidatus Magasanikbacteria bacterium GW2011_GWA2_42_32 TaxID=1619039 RepID=A0A0G1CGC0_9BACT|nr:MAG: Tyrosine recombinase XerC [Candidatus Magasanikbacteria bacterium GW2011_GWC2_40_17]KKS57596.1 MAG: Tyrosine recombinase XerC [Candidatus Magasanikbacteria bacterium GW2011_GWA2_42_32]
MDYAIRLFAAHLGDRRRSPLTVTRYRRVLDEFSLYLGKCFGTRDWTLDDVVTNCLVRFLRGTAGHEPAASTFNVRLAALRTFFEFLVAQGLAARNPAEAIPFAPTRSKEPVFLSVKEYQKLLSVARAITSAHLIVRNEAILVLLFNTGLRVSELASLTLDMLDPGTKAFRNIPLKGGQFGSVEWNRETERVLDAWGQVRKAWSTPDETRALFVSERGLPLSVRSIQQMFNCYSAELRLKKRVTAHVLRHSMATELLRQGYDIRVIAGLLHHSSLNTTKKYAHLVDALRREALASLEPGRPPRRRPQD